MQPRRAKDISLIDGNVKPASDCFPEAWGRCAINSGFLRALVSPGGRIGLRVA
jgi:hypothetical protein